MLLYFSQSVICSKRNKGFSLHNSYLKLQDIHNIMGDYESTQY